MQQNLHLYIIQKLNIMKRINYILALLIFTTSCTQDLLEYDTYISTNDRSCTTRSISDIPDPLSQINEIPVNIKSVVNGKLLSAQTKGDVIYLAPNDDGSSLQRWNINTSNGTRITLIGGNEEYTNGFIEVNAREPLRVFLAKPNEPFGTGKGISSHDGMTYTITYSKMEDLLNPYYMQPKDINSNEIILSKANKQEDITKWEIIPIDEFNIEDIYYELTTNDKLNVTPIQIATKTLVNNTDVEANRTLTFQEVITNESSFSELNGLKITEKISSSQKIGIAKFWNGEFTSDTTTEHNWTYSVNSKETQSYTITESVTQVVPPRTTIEAKLRAVKYNANMTYIAKLHGKNTQKTIYLKGKWNGTIIQESEIILTQNNTIIKTIKLKY